VWAYVQVGSDMAVDNTSIAAGQQVTITSFNLTAGGA
jgi:predicted RecA/RadA family phage recombinase